MPLNLSFGSDNHSGIHPRILEAIARANEGHCPAYGTDDFTSRTQALFKKIFGDTCEAFFVFNGTAANVLCLRALMHDHEAVITASTAHLHLDECGAPEHTIGCKMLLVPSDDGKITPEGIEKHLIRLGDQHYAQPRVVSITQPTEYGTCYSLEEIQKLREYTRQKNLFLHIDGARLIYAAHHNQTDLLSVTEKSGADAISFGGTKNGLLFGEVALIYNPVAQKHFRYIRKQNMQLPSKMRFLAVQFYEFLNEPQRLWHEIASHGHAMALYMAEGLREFPEMRVTQKVQANSVFVQLPRSWYKPLREQNFFYVWDEDKFEMRWMFSFDVTQKDIDLFLDVMRKLKSTL